jgi:hypothetical protein
MNPQPLTYLDMMKVVALFNGVYTGLVLTCVFFWARYVKQDSRQVKGEIREMVKGLLANFEKLQKEKWENFGSRLQSMQMCIDRMKERYDEHYERYHSRKG